MSKEYIKGQRIILKESNEICGVYNIISKDKLMITTLDSKTAITMKVVNVEDISPFICEKYGKECDFILPASLINQNVCDMCDIPEIRENMKSMVK